ncbi:MAG: hypothetical protein KatS3mg102_0317 [Planctomycetota bacterium]|nr:MAG: hypothetical protein KatS3mg102_0317 [Planctomycetota bacterium]
MDPSEARELEESMRAFEAALAPPEVVLPEPVLRRVVLALDGSNQDPLSEELAAAVAARTGASLHVVYAYPGEAAEPARERYREERAAQLAARGLAVSTGPRPAGAEPFAQLLAALEEGGELLVACAPYLEDFGALGHQSLGSAVEVLLQRSPVPLLLARDPERPPAELWREFLLPLVFAGPEHASAAGWALRLAPPQSGLRLLLVADTELLGSATHLLGDFVAQQALDDEVLKQLERKEHAGLIAACQKACAARGLGCRVSVRTGELAQVVAELGNAEPRVLVVAAPADPRSTAYQQALALLREAANPVLCVPHRHSGTAAS